MGLIRSRCSAERDSSKESMALPVSGKDLAEAVAKWNARPPSELERLAREVIAARGGVGLSNMLDHLAAFFAEPSQRGKQEKL